MENKGEGEKELANSEQVMLGTISRSRINLPGSSLHVYFERKSRAMSCPSPLLTVLVSFGLKCGL